MVQEAHAFRFRPDDSAGMNDQRKSESGGRQGIGNQNGFVEVNHVRLPLAFEMGQRCQGERRFRGMEGPQMPGHARPVGGGIHHGEEGIKVSGLARSPESCSEL